MKKNVRRLAKNKKVISFNVQRNFCVGESRARKSYTNLSKRRQIDYRIAMGRRTGSFRKRAGFNKTGPLRNVHRKCRSSESTGQNYLHDQNISFHGITMLCRHNKHFIAQQSILTDFNSERAKTNVLLLSLTAGGVGLNLVGANHLLLIDIHWNPQLESQAQDRIYRFGQNKDVHIYKYAFRLFFIRYSKDTLRTLYTYTHSHKFDAISILVLCNITKSEKSM